MAEAVLIMEVMGMGAASTIAAAGAAAYVATVAYLWGEEAAETERTPRSTLGLASPPRSPRDESLETIPEGESVPKGDALAPENETPRETLVARGA